jgi:phosphoribosylanthranilate isomerase
VFVKICGITRQEDAEAALEYGAGALGFVFWPESPRFIDPARAHAIASRLSPDIVTVGVFVNQTREYVEQVVEAVSLGAIQLHGDEPVTFVEGLARPVLKAIALADSTDETIDAWPMRVLILLDVHDPVRRGGTGRTVDWISASTVARRRPVVLAGGLGPQNVAEAVASVRPFGIDVSSGVESAPGLKDRHKLKALFDAVNSVATIQPLRRTELTLSKPQGAGAVADTRAWDRTSK